MGASESSTQPYPESPHHILVMRGGALGDFILTLPALRAIRKRYPRARITLATRSDAAVFALTAGYVDELSSLESSEYAALYAARPAPRPSLERFSLAVSWLVDASGVVASNLATLGVDCVLAEPPFPALDARDHMADYYVRTLAPLGISPADAAQPLLCVPANSNQWAERFLQKQAQEWGRSRVAVAMHPGSGGHYKLWPAENFAELGRLLARERGAWLLLVGGPADEGPLNDVVRGLTGLPFVVVREHSIVHLAALLRHCSLFVGNDSGISHLAAAAGTPAIAVFGPTDPAVWGPRGPAVTIVRGSCPHAPCGLERGRACADRRCLSTLPADAVANAALSYLPR